MKILKTAISVVVSDKALYCCAGLILFLFIISGLFDEC
jgi:NADH:ubiquinone oxidoreductase subunit 6 (subunit J)